MRELTISKRADPAHVAAFRTLALRVARSAKATAQMPITMSLQTSIMLACKDIAALAGNAKT